MQTGWTEIGILSQYLASLHAVNAAINAIVGRYPAIDRRLLELVLSTDSGPSSSVSRHDASLFTAQKAIHQ